MPPPDLSDDAMIEFLKRDAAAKLGGNASISSRPIGQAPKINPRFLQNTMRGVFMHNAALGSRESGEARTKLRQLQEKAEQPSNHEEPKNRRKHSDGDGDDYEDRPTKKRRRTDNAVNGEEDEGDRRRRRSRHHSHSSRKHHDSDESEEDNRHDTRRYRSHRHSHSSRKHHDDDQSEEDDKHDTRRHRSHRHSHLSRKHHDSDQSEEDGRHGTRRHRSYRHSHSSRKHRDSDQSEEDDKHDARCHRLHRHSRRSHEHSAKDGKDKHSLRSKHESSRSKSKRGEKRRRSDREPSHRSESSSNKPEDHDETSGAREGTCRHEQPRCSECPVSEGAERTSTDRQSELPSTKVSAENSFHEEPSGWVKIRPAYYKQLGVEFTIPLYNRSAARSDGSLRHIRWTSQSPSPPSSPPHKSGQSLQPHSPKSLKSDSDVRTKPSKLTTPDRPITIIVDENEVPESESNGLLDQSNESAATVGARKSGITPHSDPPKNVVESLHSSLSNEQGMTRRGRGRFSTLYEMGGQSPLYYRLTNETAPASAKGGDLDEKVEMSRDERETVQQQRSRLQAANFNREEVKNMEEGSKKAEGDLNWKKQGEVREWDIGKVMDDDGIVLPVKSRLDSLPWGASTDLE
ncbi:MAG: hypothetical protein M1820_003683 [Bogoriella megaspora]|nr:MAG: hypothetical protein M1820_003683 [Bogoriella megaspora]